MKQMREALALGALFLSMGLAPALADPVSPEIKEIYGISCKKCHGWDGTADTGEGKKWNIESFTSADFQKKTSDADILKAILEGKVDADNPKKKMKAFKDLITEAEAKELVKVVRAYAKAPGPFPGEK
ncbi:MAG: c-type cytochrome [Vulcanimicrobiota bacterium]